MRSVALLVASLLVVTASGCAKYQYRVVEPPELATTIGTKTDETVTVGPLDYAMRTVDNRLVIRIFNRGEDLVQLVGGASYVVDPDGETHPLPGQAIAPGAFVKLILPPQQPRVEPTGPRIGIGLGVGISRATEQSDDAEARPVFLQVDPRSYHWEWEGTGQVRLSLAYQSGGQEFRHDFVLRRVKVD